MKEIIATHPEFLHNPNDPNAIQLYNHLLQWEIIRRISLMFSKHWQTEVITVGRRNSRFIQVEANAEKQPRVLSADELRAAMNGNKFSLVTSTYDDVLPFQIAVPPNTTLTVTAPKDSFKEGENSGSIEFAIDQFPLLGPLYSIRITTRPLAAGQGSSGYRKYAGLSSEQERELFTYIYEVKITTETSRLRSGSPMLTLYKQWEDRMVNALRDQLDEERIYERNRRDGCLLTNDN